MLQQAFNEGQIEERATQGELTRIVWKRDHSKHRPANCPLCTWSEAILYCDKAGNPIAIIHRYLRPNGTLGASGLPDPKKMVVDNEVWIP